MATQATERHAGSSRRAAPLLASTGISVTGDGAFITAAPLLATTLTRNPIAISAVTAAFYTPWLLFGLPAGALVDRWPKRRVMVAADIVRASVLCGLIAGMLLHSASFPILIVAIVCIGIAQCFFDSASQASIPAIVGRDKDALTRVNGRFWSLDTVGRSMLGPPIGSVTFAVRQALPFAVDAVSFLASAVLIRRLPDIQAGDGTRQNLIAAIRGGLGYLVRTRALLYITLSASLYNFAYNVSMAIFVLYARAVLKVPEGAYGLLLALSAVGGVAAGWYAQSLTRRISYRQIIALTFLTQAIAWAGIALTGTVWVAGALLTLLGAGSTVSSVATSSARQSLTPDELLGRVASAYRLLALGGAALGALIGGVLASLYGLTASLAVSTAILTLGAVAIWPRHRGADVPR